ncbi:hypothetical protein AX14_004683 [Amanita brunnescens Koide BX004]|nr:hypothetical protein AX14_004683 [Amanita brunnescens Koide BX004]
MLISYALLIFALTSAVLAPTPPPQQPLFGLAWQTLQGNDLLEDGPDCPVHCWYRLKIAEPGVKPIWPDDANLDDFMCFDDPVSRVTYLKLQRVEKNDQFHLHTYKAMRKSGVNDLDIPLDGYWGRGPPTNDLNTSSDGKVRRVITFDEVAEIRTNGRERQVRFLKYEHVAESPAEYYSALTVYELTKEWQVLQGNEDPRLLEAKYPTDPPVLYPWYRLKPGDKPVWPNDENLDQIMEFIPTNGRVERASRLRLRRATTRDQLKLLLRRTGYDRVRGGHLNDPIMPLVGFWGRAKGFNNLPEDLGRN